MGLQEQKTCPMLFVEEQDSWRATIKPVTIPLAGRTKYGFGTKFHQMAGKHPRRNMTEEGGEAARRDFSPRNKYLKVAGSNPPSAICKCSLDG